MFLLRARFLGVGAIFLVGTALGHARCTKEYLVTMHQHITQLYLHGRFQSVQGLFCVAGKQQVNIITRKENALCILDAYIVS